MFCFSKSIWKVNNKKGDFKKPSKTLAFFTVHYCKQIIPVVLRYVSQCNWQTNRCLTVVIIQMFYT